MRLDHWSRQLFPIAAIAMLALFVSCATTEPGSEGQGLGVSTTLVPETTDTSELSVSTTEFPVDSRPFEDLEVPSSIGRSDASFPISGSCAGKIVIAALYDPVGAVNAGGSVAPDETGQWVIQVDVWIPFDADAMSGQLLVQCRADKSTLASETRRIDLADS